MGDNDEGLERALLDEIEEREARLLAWGDTDGSFSWDDLEDLAEEVL